MMIDTFILMLTQALALRALLVDREILKDAEIESYCKTLQNSEAMKKARESLGALDVKALLSTMKIDGPIQ